MKIGITGATGQLGALAIEALIHRSPDKEIVALARDPGKHRGLSVEVRRANYRLPETLASATAGLDVLVLISSSDFEDRPQQHRNVIRAAKASGVKRLIYTSILKGSASPMLMAEDHKITEHDIVEADLPATILRNGWYTENYTDSLPQSIEHGALIGAAKNGRLSTAPRADYAEAIAVVASQTGHDGKVYELAGDDPYTLSDLAVEVSRQTGKPIPYRNMSRDDYVEALQAFGLSQEYALVVADADAWAAEGALLDESGTLSRLIGRPTVPMKTMVARNLRQTL